MSILETRAELKRARRRRSAASRAGKCTELRDPVALLVDEDANVVRQLSAFLSQGFSVLGAGSVAEAKRWLRGAPRIDLAFVEQRLPDGSGIEVLNELWHRYPRSARLLMASRTARRALFGPDLEVAHVLLDKPLDFGLVRRVWAAACRLDT